MEQFRSNDGLSWASGGAKRFPGQPGRPWLSRRAPGSATTPRRQSVRNRTFVASESKTSRDVLGYPNILVALSLPTGKEQMPSGSPAQIQLQKEQQGCLYLCGGPGTGKTALVREVLRGLVLETRQQHQHQDQGVAPLE